MGVYLGSNYVAVNNYVEAGGGSEWVDVSSHFTFDTSYITVQEVHAVSNSATIDIGSIIYFNATITILSGYSGLDEGFLQTDFPMGDVQAMMVSGYDSNSNQWYTDFAAVETSSYEFGSVSALVDGSDIYLNATIMCIA